MTEVPRFLLDTNIVSLLDERRHQKAPGLIAWMERNGAFLYLSAITITEMEAGILKLKREDKYRRAAGLTTLLETILADFGDRVLPMDSLVALTVARLADRARPSVVELADLIVAATAERYGLLLLTANVKHFVHLGIALANPLEKLPPDVIG